MDGKVGQLVRSIRMQLGQDRMYGVTVEASDAQIVHAIRLAVAEYLRYHPTQSHQSFLAQRGIHVYTPSPPIDGVVEVNMIEALYSDLATPESALLGGRLVLLGAAYPFTSPYTFSIYRHWLQIGKKIFSSQPEWRFVPEDGNLYLYIPQQDVRVSLVGTISADAVFGEDDDWEVEKPPGEPSTPKYDQLNQVLRTIKEHHITAWIRKLAFAKTKEIVGYQRRKFGGVPGADRQNLQMDGDNLIREADQLWKDTFKDMFASAPNIPPSLG